MLLCQLAVCMLQPFAVRWWQAILCRLLILTMCLCSRRVLRIPSGSCRVVPCADYSICCACNSVVINRTAAYVQMLWSSYHIFGICYSGQWSCT
jgi:hypothetical protein